MAVSALNITPGSPTANAYVSLAVANQYHLDRPAAGTTWSAATPDQKNAAILWATLLLDRLFYWNGFVASSEQKLMWPRTGLVAANGWIALDYLTIPLEIQRATAEFARQLIAADRTADSDIETQGLKLIKVGSVRVDFKDDVYAKPIPDIIIHLIPYDWGYPRANGERELVRS